MARIEHVIVLVMENRSFDHMLGFLDHPDPAYPRISDGQTCGGLPVTSTATLRTASPNHSHWGTMSQLFGGPDFDNEWTIPLTYPTTGTNEGFARSFELRYGKSGQYALRCFHPELIPVLSTLAKEYAVCTNWYCSVPGATWPNRDFIIAGTSFGAVDQRYATRSTGDHIFDRLQDAGASWRIYQEGVGHTWLYTDIFHAARFSNMDRLYHDIANDSLPNFAYVEPDYGLPGSGNSQHPHQAHTGREFVAGEQLIADIYNALVETMPPPGSDAAARESVFAKTLFVVTYDEHGGFYDRMRPPECVQPRNSDVAGKFRFDLLGPRVPALLISPWIPRGTIVDTKLEHASIPATLRALFAPEEPSLTRRDARAATFQDVVGNTLRTRQPAADAVEIVHAYDYATAQTEAERLGATMNPADYPGESHDELEESMLWVAADTRERLDGKSPNKHAPASAIPTFNSDDERTEFLQRVVDDVQGSGATAN